MENKVLTTQGEYYLVKDTDGIDHINVVSKAQTKLGTWLTNMHHSPFTHPEYGHFRNMEGYWHWCATGKSVEELRDMNGFTAKKYAKDFPKVRYEGFEQDIISGMIEKLKQNSYIYFALMESDHSLPFAHYFRYVDVVRDAYANNAFWLMELEAIRNSGLSKP